MIASKIKFGMRSVAYTLLVALFFSSCISNKRLIYFQDYDGKYPADALIDYQLPEYRIQANDILDIQVVTIDDLLERGFTLTPQIEGMGMGMQAGLGGGDIYYMTGFSVTNEGYVRLPLIGPVMVRNLTLEEIRQAVEKELEKIIKAEFLVRVKLGGVRFAALGEFRTPGKFVILQDRVTIYEAISTAGDMTTLAKRDEVTIVRQYPDGSRIHKVNLLDRNIINSEFYFIQPNDQLYVEPMRVREAGTGENFTQSLSIFISSISLIGLIISISAR
ncbi:MAG: polysaccharide biosynthesis/export family protein [Nitritalea sp.]